MIVQNFANFLRFFLKVIVYENKKEIYYQKITHTHTSNQKPTQKIFYLRGNRIFLQFTKNNCRANKIVLIQV